MTQIKVTLLINHHKLIPKLSSSTFQHSLPSFLPPRSALPPSLYFLHPAPGHVLFIGISPQSAVLIVHLCRSRGAACNMALVIICAHCVRKNILQTHMGTAVDHHSTEANCCCGLIESSKNKQLTLTKFYFFGLLQQTSTYIQKLMTVRLLGFYITL